MNNILENKDYSEKITYMAKNNFKSKWANLQNLLQDKNSSESSVKLLKKQTIDQFSSKCCETYQYKIKIHLLTQINKQIFSSSNKYSHFNYPQIIIKSDVEDLCSDPSLKNFLFYFRENNEEMLKLINLLSNEQKKIVIPFLCHFFYENFCTESTEQVEIFYIIYLLLEKEIDNLCAPLVDSFLNDSFIGDFLKELGNKYEIKNYLDIILNSLIREFDEVNSNYISMDIVNNSKIHLKNFRKFQIKHSFFDMKQQNFYQNEMFFSQSSDTSQLNPLSLFVCMSPTGERSFTVKKKKVVNDQWSEIDIELKYEKEYINKYLDKNFFNQINENYIKKLFENEKDEFMKSFYMKQLKKIKSLKNPNLFNCKNYYFEKMVNAENISKKSIDQYNEGYKVIIEFINNLFSNLGNKNIIPYIIKVICKIIYLLLKKRFKNISEMQLIILVCRFLFDKLIIPILENPDSSNIVKLTILTLNTRKTLFSISLVLKKLIRGELFSEEKYECYNIFNQFILDNYHKLKTIIHNIIDVKMPNKISLLLDKFYNDDNFSLNNQKRKSSEINYDYFNENPNEFMQHDSICFNITQFFIFYDIVNKNKNIFIKEGSVFNKIFKDLSIFIPEINNKNPNYYVIIKENYIEEVKELLFHKEKMIGLSKSKEKKDLLYKLKFCITYLLSKIQISSQWDWVNDNYDTMKTFDFINRYLLISEKIDFTKKAPLTWFSKYILNNLQLIDNSYIKNDFELLYEEIENDVHSVIDKLNLLNEFLTVNIRTKFYLIEKRKQNYKKDLLNMEKIELNIRALFFLESAEINVCFMDGESYNYIQARSLSPNDKIDKYSFTISNMKHCPHRNLDNEEMLRQTKKGMLSQYHCKKIRDFADKYSQYHNIISEEIVNHYLSSLDKQNNTSSTPIQPNDISGDMTIITQSLKDILDIYMNYLSKIIQDHPIFNINNSNDISKVEQKKKNKEKVMKIIWNYILKSLCIKIYDSKPLDIDKAFKIRCISLNSFIKPINLEISQELCDEKILDKVKYHLKEIDKKRTPDGMNEEFGMAVQLIGLLYKFYLNQTSIEAGDLLHFIIYSIISLMPERIIFNISFCKYFLNQGELLGNFGYNMIQAESAISYINKLNSTQLGFTDEEFNSNLSQITFQNYK